MPDIVITVAGPVTVHLGVGVEEIRTIVAAELAAALTPLESKMTTVNEALDALTAQADANSVALNDLVDDVRALVAILTDPDDDTELSPSAQAKVEALQAKLAGDAATVGALDAEVGDANNSDTPPVGDPEVPAEG